MSSSQPLPESPRTPTLAEVIRAAMDHRLRQVHVALPGRVESYNAEEQRADVQPMIQELTPTRAGGELLESLPVIPSVPVAFPRGGGYFLTFPIKAGDFVTLVFAERSIDTWVAGDGAEKNPDDFRTHDLSDAIAIPGFYPFGQSVGESAIDADLVMGKDGGSTIHIKDNGEIHLAAENADQFVALAQKVLDELNQVKADLDAVKTTFDSHMHITTATVGLAPPVGSIGVIGPASAAGSVITTPHTPQSVAAEKVKAT